MWRTLWATITGVGLAFCTGCATAPLLDNPEVVAPGPVVLIEQNPLYVPLGPTFASYRKVFEGALTALTDFGFEIADANAYDGRIETLPRVSPGLLQPFRNGNADAGDRLLHTLQSYRDRASVMIQPADNGGYFIRVTVFKELEDLPRPVRSTIGGAIFRNANNLERQYDVVDPTVFEMTWIPKGRNVEVEQQILCAIKKCL